ncbi:unnamed protein product [Meloidogyne enterolobii]|uniref:Uncharacterized protein n=1 Tax=Meloidogyne enterolobii TaxID=390850 RepID=A0ACB1A3M3_MELEN
MGITPRRRWGCYLRSQCKRKNDSRSACVNTNNNVYDSSRGILQPISKTGSPIVNKTSVRLAGDLRQRLDPTTKSGGKSKTKHGFGFIIGGGKGHQQQQKRMATQITVDGNSNIIASSNNCSSNNNNTSNIAIDGPFLGSDNKQNEHSTSNWSSSQAVQQQQQQNNCSSPITSRVQWPLAAAPLLSSPTHRDRNKKCLILDLDETLVHSSFKPVKNADFVIPIEIDNVVHQVYVLKRPHTDHFLERVGALFECVLFTASLAKYADPVADLLDRRQVFRFRLFREACVFFEGNYVKDLEKLGRDLRKVVIIDNSPASYAFHPNNSLPIRTWFDDPDDTELLDLLPILEELARVEDIYSLIGNFPSSLPSLQQQQRYQQQQQRLQQQYSSPYYQSTTTTSTTGPSSIITQAPMPSCDANNNTKAFSTLSIRNGEEEEDQKNKQQKQSSSLIYIQMDNNNRRGGGVEDEENNNMKKKREENLRQEELQRLRRRNNNNNSNNNVYNNVLDTSNISPTNNNINLNNNKNNSAASNNVVDYYSMSRPSTSFGGKKWK